MAHKQKKPIFTLNLNCFIDIFEIPISFTNAKNMQHTRAFLYILLLFFCTNTHAQMAVSAQAVANQQYDSYISSPYFDVYFSAGNEQNAQIAAKYAEIARAELGHLFDYRPSSRYLLFYAADANAVAESNFAEENAVLQSGMIPLPRLDACVVQPETQTQLYMAVKKQVAKLMLREFDFGQDLPNVVQSELLSYHPKWYIEGMSDYVAYGWDYEDDMWLGNATSKDFLANAIEGNDETSRILRKSIWFYIAHEYGPQKFPEILYIAKIARSVEAGIISVLGVTINTFTDRWREFLLKRIPLNKNGRISIYNINDAEKIVLPPKYSLISYTFHEKTNTVALYLEKKNKHSVFLYEVENKTFTPLNISSGFPTPIHSDLHFEYPMAWNKTGDILTTTARKKGKNHLVFYHSGTGDIDFVPIDSTIQHISNIAWANDGRKMAISALKNGKKDIFIVSADGENWKQITNDMFDEIEPTWSYDDQRVYFSSNRDTISIKSKNAFHKILRQNFDIYAYEPEGSQDTFVRITQTPLIQERNPYNPNSFEIYYRSDESGVWDIHKLNIFLNEHSYVNNTEEGILKMDFGEKSYLTQTLTEGGNALFLLPLLEKTIQTVAYTPLRNEVLTELRTFPSQKVWAESDSVPEIAANPDSTSYLPPSGGAGGEQPDSLRKEPRFYVFDEGDVPYTVRKAEKKSAKKSENVRKDDPQKIHPIPEWKDIKLEIDNRALARWRTENFKIQVIYEPVARLGATLAANFTDMRRNQSVNLEVTPFINFQNSNARLRYSYLKKKIDFYGEAESKIRFLRSWSNSPNSYLDSLIFRYVQLNVKAGAVYPINAFWNVGAEGAFYANTRFDLKLVHSPTPQNQYNNVFQSSIFANYQHFQQIDDYIIKGSSFNASLSSFQSLKTENASFGRVKVTYKHYQPIYKRIVWATCLRSALSFGNQGQQYYLGGADNLLLGYFLSQNARNLRSGTLNTENNAFNFQDFLLPMRGFQYNNRSGSKYIVANTEIRLPLQRIQLRTLNEHTLYNWELIPFMDFGMIWRKGVPFSQKNPTDVQTISNGPVLVVLQTLKSPFLMAFGTGIKANFLAHVVRMDVSMGIDDGTLQPIMMSFSLGRPF